jgi:quercetin dioxygenase-like cupin family protein
VEIGFSTHEQPDNCDPVKVAIAKGATLFEKHVGVPTEQFKLNAYSANPAQLRRWLEAAQQAYRLCGVKGQRHSFSAAELGTLRDLQRGLFAKEKIVKGQRIQPAHVFFAIPNLPTQVVANDFSKYTDFYATEDIEPNAPVMRENTRRDEKQKLVYQAIQQVKDVLRAGRVIVPSQVELEVSHHYGLENFGKYGSTIITVVNREYCKRLIVLLPGQTHPEQWHKLKDETYHILHGEIDLALDGIQQKRGANDIVIIPRGVKHGFTTSTGVIIEEISTYYTQGDSYYTDGTISQNGQRKTLVTHWMD